MVTVTAPLAFFRPDKVSPDSERPGLLRAARVSDPDNPAELSFHDCQLHDWSTEAAAPLDLDKLGFDTIDLSALKPVQQILRRVREAGEISKDDARQLRRALTGQVFPLSSGKRLRLLSIAPEGLIMRKGGPNGLDPDPDVQMSEMNGHAAALAIHGDQDVRGTPLKQLMRGFAPWIFRHQSPDGNNRWSPIVLVNLWIPLDQITRPLTFMDRRTLNKRQHQCRYALPTDAFLERSEDMTVNDIWTFLHDTDQRWYFSSDMDFRQAYVFDTLGTPHGATILPGEEQLEQGYLALQSACDALARGDREAARQCAIGTSLGTAEGCTSAIAAALRTTQGLLRELCQGGLQTEEEIQAWLCAAQEVMRRVVRKSIEMRVVAMQLPRFWPAKAHA